MSETASIRESQVIENRFREWAALEVKKDLRTWLRFLADDAVLQPAGEPEVRGKAAIEAYAAKFFELPIEIMEPGPQTVVVGASSDLAFNAGPLRIVLDSPNGKIELDMKSAVIWRKVGGEWKIALNSWSANSQ